MLKKVREASFSDSMSIVEDMSVSGSFSEKEEGKKKIKIKKKKPIDFSGQTYTITFSETVENHVGMEKISKGYTEGYSYDELVDAYHKFKDAGADVDFIDLKRECGIDKTKFKDDPKADAYLLVVYDGCRIINIDPDQLFLEQKKIIYDTKAYMRGRVVNKIARHNLCFADYAAIADFDNGKGTVISFDSLKYLNRIRDTLPDFIPRSEKLYAEGNKYYDVQKCYISFHGDAERKKIIGIRLGESFPIHYQYYHQTDPIGERFTVKLPHGCLYVMDEKTSGNDWKKRKIVTIRHAAGLLKNIL